MIDKMKSGSVIFDLAATQGGNAAYSEVDKIVDKNGKKIIGISNVMNKLPLTASNLYAKNLFSFVRNLYSRDKTLVGDVLSMKLRCQNTLIRSSNYHGN